MFIDKAKIFIKAGNGGDGAVSFHREKYVPNGGPNGGDGGNGGSVIFVASDKMSTLIDFKFSKHFRAENGGNGSGDFCRGTNGEDVYVKVPVGTVVKDAETGGIIADMYYDGDEIVVLQGGNGGKGNARFATSTRRAPRFAQKGIKTEEHAVILELKTIADVGLVGFPNVGKSTLLSVITHAKPKIANYHFTTLSPNLGVVSVYDDSFVVADIPGLIEGAAEGAGLGHSFLRHIERVRLIVHVLDISGSEGRDPYDDYNQINAELVQYAEELGNLPQIVVATKIDMLEDEGFIKEFEKKIGVPVIPVCAIIHEGIDVLIDAIYKKLQTLPKSKPLEFEKFEYSRPDNGELQIERDYDGAFLIYGGIIESLVRNVVLSDEESFRYFQKLLRDKGVIKALRDYGVKEGDIVRIYDTEFEYQE
ncbi:MAG: GTPase ObgE [Clostridia bacterium]|nr:GTPase ObgE [Clostridia bacterium]